MTYGDIQSNTPEEELIYYVYMWYAVEDGEIKPFYVGLAYNKTRWKNKSIRGKEFKEFAAAHECKSMILAKNLEGSFARELERRFKTEFKEMGFHIIDAEDDKMERKIRQRNGLDAMPVISGKRVSTKTGRPIGRPEKQVQYELMPGETVSAACERLGISRTQWYRAQKQTA